MRYFFDQFLRKNTILLSQKSGFCVFIYVGLLKSEIPWNGKKTVAVRVFCIMPGYCSCGFVFWEMWDMPWQNV